MSRALWKVLPVLLLSAVAAAVAQQHRYAGPGDLSERRLDLHEALMELRGNARWRLGFLDLEPELAITDVGYVSNVYSARGEESESDLRATGRAGLRGFFNLGSDIVVSPYASLSYSWWQEQEDLRELNDSFGLQLFGDFNRLKFHVGAARLESQGNLNSELEVPVDLGRDRFEFGLDIDFWGPFRLFAGAETSDARYSGTAAGQNVPGLDLAALDVDTERLRGGIGYEFPGGLEVAVGLMQVEARYLVDPGGRSNRGTGPMMRIHFEGSRLFLELEAAWRDLEFVRQGGDRRELNGLGQIEWRFTRRLAAGAYAGNQVAASALDNESIFESRRTGLFLRRLHGDSGAVRLFYEVGDDDFATLAADRTIRSDDFRSYGVNFAFDLGARLTVDLSLFDSRRDSTDPSFDRDLTSVRAVIRLGGDLLSFSP